MIVQKYIMFKDNTFLMFPTYMVHKEVATKQGKLENVVSAGLVCIAAKRGELLGVNIECYDESFTLNVKSRGKVDSDIMSASILQN